jgi:hypothetical protein
MLMGSGDKVIVEPHFAYMLIPQLTGDTAFLHYGSVYLNLIITSLRLKNVTKSVTKGKIVELIKKTYDLLLGNTTA